MNNSFIDLKINQNLIEGLEKQNITIPTEIQQLVIKSALENKDIIGESYTGSGKTLSYLLPIFHKIDTAKREMQAIILAPTHELVMQIEEQVSLLAKNSEIPVTSLTIIGEASMEKQIKKLKDNKPHIIVGTIGRVLDLIQKKKIKAHTVKTIVIDEADNLLSESSLGTVNNIIKTTMRDRQLMAFSATINPKTLDTAKALMKEPEVFKTDGKVAMNPRISHEYIVCSHRDKFEILRKLIAATKTERAIVFLNKNEEIKLITDKLNYHSKNAGGIYGAASKEERKNTINSFKSGKINLLVSSDLSARGLDVPEVTHIFNLDFPVNTNDYSHRAGRTARGNLSGTCISIITEKELAAIRVYEREFNVKFEQIDVYEGRIHKA